MTKLMSPKFDCDFVLYLDSLDAVLIKLRNEPDENLLLALVEPPSA